MQPMIIEAKSPVRASDGGRSNTAAASGSASFAVLLRDTGPGGREAEAPRTGKGEKQRPKNDTAAAKTDTPESDTAKTGTAKADATETDAMQTDAVAPDAGETAKSDGQASDPLEDGAELTGMPVLSLIPGLEVPQPAMAAAVAAVIAQPVPAGTPAPGAIPDTADLPLQTVPQASAEAALAGEGEGEGKIQAQAAAANRQANATALPEATPESFDDVLASTVAASGDRSALAAAASAKNRSLATTQVAAAAGRGGDAMQPSAVPAQVSQAQTQVAVEAAGRPRGLEGAQIQAGASGPTDAATPIWTRGDASGAVNPFSPAAAAAPQSADPAAPAMVRAPVVTPPVHDQLAVHIQRAVAQGTDRITIQLSPAELGRIDIRLEVVEHGRVSATVVVERAETLDLLQRDSRGLERALQDAGLKPDAGGLNFTLRDDGRRDGSGRQPTGAESMPKSGIESLQVEPAVATRTIYGSGAIDIRV